MLRWGQGTHCCGRCKLGHKIHGFHCERVEFETAISAADDAAFGTDPDTTSAAAEHARAPSTDLRWDYADTDGDWSEPGPPDNINWLNAERQVIASRGSVGAARPAGREALNDDEIAARPDQTRDVDEDDIPAGIEDDIAVYIGEKSESWRMFEQWAPHCCKDARGL